MKNEICLCLILLFTLMSSTCSKEEDVALFKTPYTGNELRLDGYYYSDEEVSFFYRDGVGFNVASRFTFSLLELEEFFRSEDWGEATRNHKANWGIFTINQGEITWERWGNDSVGPLKTVVRSGSIINDSTFLITSFYNGYSEETTVKNDTFQFKQFSPKPDSTNIFVQ